VREHRITVALGDQQQRLHRRLPFLGIVLGLRQLGDVERGIVQRDQLAPSGQLDFDPTTPSRLSISEASE